MSAHIDRRKQFWAVRGLETRRRMIYECALDPIDRRILQMYHIEFKSFDYIADSLGYSRSQIGRRYNRALKMLELD